MADNFNLTAYLAQPTPWENKPGSVLGIVISVTTVSLLCILSRLYIRVAVVQKAGWDDFFVTLYSVASLTTSISTCIATNYGLGEHLLLFTVEKLRMFLILFYIGNASYITATTLIKLSLLFQYLRIFDKDSALRRICQVLIVFVGVWGAVFAFMAWVPCFPVKTYWDLTLGEGTCYGFGLSTDRTTFVVHTSLNMLFDFCVLSVPVPLYFEKGASRRTRNSMLGLLALGCLVNFFAAWRLVLLIVASDSPMQTLFDSTYFAPASVLLSALEVNLASMCASIPIFWPVLQQRLFRILVTREVVVTSDERQDGSQREKTRRRGSSNSSNSSDSSDSRPAKVQHYVDQFLLDQIGPFRQGSTLGVETVVCSEKQSH